MNASDQPRPSRVAGFRTRLLIAMMLVVGASTGLALYFAERHLAASVELELQRAFEGELAALQNAEDIRHAVIDERCRALARRSRFDAALEDRPEPDLLYPSAQPEMRDITAPDDEAPAARATRTIYAEFYRFLDRTGAVIPPRSVRGIGSLDPMAESRIALRRVPAQPQTGYLRPGGTGPTVLEIVASPIFSAETGEPIAALVLGFKPFGAAGRRPGLKAGFWFDGRLDIAGLDAAGAAAIAAQLGPASTRGAQAPGRIEVGGGSYRLFIKLLNPGSLYPPAYEVCLYSLSEYISRQRSLRWSVLGTGALLLLGGLGASHYAAGRLARPVEALAVDSEEDRARRARAEAALELTHEELQRSARFSADASHQLKTPVTVMRAGLEELLTRDNLTPDECDQISALIHQTYRLSSLIEDLLLLSRMDAGRLKLEFAPVDLSALIEAALDDLSALPDDQGLRIETSFHSGLHIAGEKRYTTIILQNLLENARKYNRPGGRLSISASEDAAGVVLRVGNTGRPITQEARGHIFERFHRGAMGENVPGYGLGLNLARELARLHRGELRLARSEADWTEFEVRFQIAAIAINRS